MAQNSKLGYGNKQKDWVSAEPSPNDRYARSMDAVQRLNVSGSERTSNSQ